jgi:hypothetical protein
MSITVVTLSHWFVCGVRLCCGLQGKQVNPPHPRGRRIARRCQSACQTTCLGL